MAIAKELSKVECGWFEDIKKRPQGGMKICSSLKTPRFLEPRWVLPIFTVTPDAKHHELPSRDKKMEVTCSLFPGFVRVPQANMPFV